MKLSGQRHASADLPPRKHRGHQQNRRLGGSQRWPGRFGEKISRPWIH